MSITSRALRVPPADRLELSTNSVLVDRGSSTGSLEMITPTTPRQPTPILGSTPAAEPAAIDSSGSCSEDSVMLVEESTPARRGRTDETPPEVSTLPCATCILFT